MRIISGNDDSCDDKTYRSVAKKTCEVFKAGGVGSDELVEDGVSGPVPLVLEYGMRMVEKKEVRTKYQSLKFFILRPCKPSSISLSSTRVAEESLNGGGEWCEEPEDIARVLGAPVNDVTRIVQLAAGRTTIGARAQRRRQGEKGLLYDGI